MLPSSQQTTSGGWSRLTVSRPSSSLSPPCLAQVLQTLSPRPSSLISMQQTEGVFSRFYLGDLLKILFIYFQRDGKGESKKGKETSMRGCLSRASNWPTTQACALTGSRTSNLLACRPVSNPLSHTSQGERGLLKTQISSYYCPS